MTNDYRKYIARKWTALVVLAVFTAGIALFSLTIGAAGLSPLEILRVLFGGGDDVSRTVILNLRLPRVATAIGVGIALALAGCIMQNVLRNPLASPATLGVTQGATFGAAVAIVYFQAAVGLIPVFAFLGGIATAVVILLLSRRTGATSSMIILAGVAMGAMFTGAVALVQYFSDDIQIGSIVYWTFGNLGRAGLNEISLIYIFSGAAFVYFLLNRWNYNAMESGMATAKSLGVNVEVMTLVSMTIATLISAVAVAFVGTINFIGLIAPHIVRKFVGNDYRFLVPCSAFMGAIIMLVADIVSRTLAAPAVLPIGALTSFLGAPLFLYMVIKKGNVR